MQIPTALALPVNHQLGAPSRSDLVLYAPLDGCSNGSAKVFEEPEAVPRCDFLQDGLFASRRRGRCFRDITYRAAAIDRLVTSAKMD